jgi:membrane protein DedA with SNARE-associated domain
LRYIGAAMDLVYILDLIRQHGDVAYGFMFAYAASNSLLMPLFAGYAAHQGALDWGTLVLVCWAGSICGDSVRFAIGRRWGRVGIAYFPRAARHIDTVIRLIDRHYIWMLLIYRYPHFIRGIAGFVFGMSVLPWPRLLILNAISAGLWAVVVVSIGYSFGHVSEKTLGETASGLSFAVLAVFLGLAWVLSKKLEDAVERQGRI